jgi:hypothetical protein
MSDYTEYYEYYKKAWEKSLSKGTEKGGAMVRIKMGGYVDQNDKIMTKEDLDAWIIKIQEENARLREALKSISGIYNDEDEPSKGYAGNIAREALKGGE